MIASWYGAADIAMLRRDIRDATHCAALNYNDPYYPDCNAYRGIDEMRARLKALRTPVPAGTARRNAVLWRINTRQHLDRIGKPIKAAAYARQTIEYMRAGNIDAMYLDKKLLEG